MEDYEVILGYAAIVNNEQMGMQADAIVLANLADNVTEGAAHLQEVDGSWRCSWSAAASG